MASTWSYLKLSQEYISTPPVLISYEFSPSSYKIWLTDLTYIWMESIERRAIIYRSFISDTSIDPSEDSEQMQLLLRSIQDALEQKPGTNVDLSYNDQLSLSISTSLPVPLKALAWSISLTRVSHSTMKRKLVVPLLSQHATSKIEKTSLLQQLRDKDAVIAKLIQHMQTNGIELSKVFPGAGLSKPTAKSKDKGALGKSVKGLAEFDEDQWQSRIPKTSDDPRGLLEIVSSFPGTDMSSYSESSLIPDHDNWWERLGRRNLESSAESIGSARSGIKEETNLANDDEFQTQAALPRVQTSSSQPRPVKSSMLPNRRPRLSNPASADNDSTTDEGETDPQPSMFSHLSPKASSAKGLSLENPQSDTQDTTMVDDVATSRPKAEENNESSDDSKCIGDVRPRFGATTSNLDQTCDIRPVPKPKSKLGKIGGKKVGASTNDSQSEDHAEFPVHSKGGKGPEQSPTQKPNDLSASSVARSVNRGRTSVQGCTPHSPPRETSEERADRQREELKRRLNSENVGKTKKKRKF